MSTALCSSLGEIDAGLLLAFVAWDRQNPLATAVSTKAKNSAAPAVLA